VDQYDSAIRQRAIPDPLPKTANSPSQLFPDSDFSSRQPSEPCTREDRSDGDPLSRVQGLAKMSGKSERGVLTFPTLDRLSTSMIEHQCHHMVVSLNKL